MPQRMGRKQLDGFAPEGKPQAGERRRARLQQKDTTTVPQQPAHRLVEHGGDHNGRRRVPKQFRQWR